jgi:hypothetical protein
VTVKRRKKKYLAIDKGTAYLLQLLQRFLIKPGRLEVIFGICDDPVDDGSVDVALQQELVSVFV